MPRSGSPLDKPFQLFDLLRRGLDANADSVAIASLDKQGTWRELSHASDRLAANLLGLGLHAGDRVASLMPNCDALLVHYIACAKAGLVATPLNYRYQAPEIDHALEVSEASILLAHAERDAEIAKTKLAAKLPLGVIGYGASDGRSRTYEALIEQDPPTIELRAPDPAAPAIIFFTSGSTGPAKGVTHSFETFGWLVASIIESFELTQGDIVLPGSSLSHIAGLSLSLAAVAAGSRVIITRTFDGDELLSVLREDRPTVLMMLPAALFSLARDHGATKEDFTSLRLCVSGGDKVSAELEREFTELAGFPIDEGYGMSEIGWATLNPPSGLNKLGSIGTLNPGYAASIRNESGEELADGEDGRLWIKAPSDMVRYWNQPEATEVTFQDGWLDTGDQMRIDDDGYLWFRGRKKQIIVHDGSNIAPQEVEEALLEHPAVEIAGVVGVHDLVHGENVRAYITLRGDAARPTSQTLIRFARERVGYKAPEEIVVLKEMPLNPAGKVDRVTLKRMAVDLHADTALG